MLNLFIIFFIVMKSFAEVLQESAIDVDGRLRYHAPGCMGGVRCTCREKIEAAKKLHPNGFASLELMITNHIGEWVKDLEGILQAVRDQRSGDLDDAETFARLTDFYKKMRAYAMAHLRTGELPEVEQQDVIDLVNSTRNHINSLMEIELE
jgi:hypothetical protein